MKEKLKKVPRTIFKNFIETQIEYLKLWKSNWWLLILDIVVITLSFFVVIKGWIDKNIILLFLVFYLIFSSIKKIYLQIKHIQRYDIIDFLIHAFLLIIIIVVLFALIYMIPIGDATITGIENPNGLGEYFYFSGVTFFSLGYGDLAPTGGYRYIAVLEVFIGVFFFGSLVAMGLNLIYEKMKEKRWAPLKRKVTEELNEQFSGILTDIAMICAFREVMVFSSDIPEEEIWKKSTETVLGKVKKFAEEGGVKISKHYKEHVLKGDFGTLFKSREEFLSTFQIKYMDYLEPDVLINLIDVQKAFHFIDQDIIVRNKQVKNNWLRLDNDDVVILRIEDNLQKIIEAIQFMANKGILKYR